jgi:hypothetical protein
MLKFVGASPGNKSVSLMARHRKYGDRGTFVIGAQRDGSGPKSRNGVILKIHGRFTVEY